MEDSLTNLIEKLHASLEAAYVPIPECESILATSNGLSLLNIKNELFATYLQNLTFLLLSKLRQRTRTSNQKNDDREDALSKAIETRVYIERGVQPLESRLKYQIDKVIRAAQHTGQRKKTQRVGTKGVDNQIVKADQHSGSDDASDSSTAEDDLAYRPNLAALAASTNGAGGHSRTNQNTSNGVYRPPRITPIAPPTADRRSKYIGPQRSAAVEDYINFELSTAPTHEPSIGSTITAGGKSYKSDKERREEQERTAYEEANFVRLPGESKRDRAKKQGSRTTSDRFGGESFYNMDARLDRISSLTSKGSSNRARSGMRDGRPPKRMRI